MKILNFGSLNIDYVYSVEHFVRPGETLSALERTIFPGGKGLNQSIALARALQKDNSAEVFHAGIIGKSDGSLIKNILLDSGICLDFLKEIDSPSGHTIIQVDHSGQNCILLYGGANQLHDIDSINYVLSHFEKGDFLVLQYEINNIDYIISEALKKEMVIFFNPSPYKTSIQLLPLEKIDYILVNEIEASEITSYTGTAVNELIVALKKQFSTTKLVLTLGQDGVVFIDGHTTVAHGIYEVPVVDTTAAGDTFTGYFIAGIALGYSIEETLRVSSIASALTVSREGASPAIPYMDEVVASPFKLAPKK